MKKTIKVLHFSILGNESSDVDFIPAGVQGDKSLMMWKEILRTGIFYQPDGSRHVINEDYLHHLVETFDVRNAKGIKIPMPLGHTYDPESNRGFVKYLEIRNSSNGKSVWALCEFIDAEAKENLKGSDVSISAPEELYDGDGVRYQNALEHVCFTDYPVVYGMEGFRDVKFDLTKGMTRENWTKIQETKRNYCATLGFKPVCINFSLIGKDKGMNLKELLNKLGIDPEKLTSQDEAFEKIGDAFDEIQSKSDDETQNFSKKKKKCFSEDEDDEDVRYGKKMAKKKRFSEDDDEEEEGKTMSKKRRFSEKDEEEETNQEKTMSRRKRFSEEEDEDDKKSATFSMKNILRENRQMKIKNLLDEGFITTDQAKALKQEFCNDHNIQFSLNSAGYNAFEQRVEFIKKGARITSYDDYTGAQVPGVRFSGNPSRNPFEEVLEKRYGRNQ